MLPISVLLKNFEEQSFRGLSELGGDGNTSSDRAGLLLRIRATPVSLPRSSGRVLRPLSIGPTECSRSARGRRVEFVSECPMSDVGSLLMPECDQCTR